MSTALNVFTRQLRAEQIRNEADERRKKEEERNREERLARMDPAYQARQLAQMVNVQQRRIDELERAGGIQTSATPPVPIVHGSLLERSH